MIPTLVLVGRPNVGKSTLFNRLTRTREALVADLPGLTRDRHYGRGRIGERAFLVVDTGGFEPDAREGLVREMARQTEAALAEADAVILVADARTGPTPQDHAIAQRLRRTGRRCLLAVNKAEGLPAERAGAEFWELGLGAPLPISAAHGDNVTALVEAALEGLGGPAPEAEPAAGRGIAVAVVGRPNVGKSTLVNALLGEERVIAFDQPGTTRDAIRLPFEYGGEPYTLIDTAGLRRRGRLEEAVEKFSVIKTLQAIEDADVVILVLDARAGLAEQDAHIAGSVLEAGRAVVVAVNKWDALAAREREAFKRDLDRRLAFLAFARTHFVSARERLGLAPLMASVRRAHAAATARLATPRLTRAVAEAVERQPPPRAGLVRPKLRYAHQGGVNPPRVVVHGSALDRVPDAYRRYLEHFLREAFKLEGTPLRIEWRSGANPYARGKPRA